jgi:putative ABC transport system permease protein
VRVALERQREGVTERAVVDLEVARVLPVAQLSALAVLAPLPLLEAVQAWRDGYTIPAFSPDGNGPPPVMDVYPLFRLYATSIQAVAPLVDRLETEGISVHARTREIEATLGLQRNLRAVLSLVGLLTAAGAVIALTALQISTVRRKRREYALFKLTGHGRAWLMAMPCLNAVAVALMGGLLALLAHAAAAWAINLHFAAHLATGEAAVRLHAVDVAAGLAAALIVSVLPALWGGWRASLVEAADELRDP